MNKITLLLALAASFIGFAQPANDDCAGAVTLPVSTNITCTTTAGTLSGATVSTNSSGCSNTIGQDVWYQFTALNTIQRVNFTYPSQTNNTPLHIILYTGTCEELAQQACHSGSSTLNDLIVGQTYMLRVYAATTNIVTTNFNICVNVPQPAITIDTDYTTEQLVNDVLINSSCFLTSNISSSAITNPGTVATLGYYEQNESSFASASGIVLSTGNILNLPGPTNNITSSQGTMAGDADLQTMMGTYGNFGTYSDASSIEFDFVPMVDHISFDFIFASNEYGTYQCSFADAFAFILTDLTTGEKTNLAVIPNTTIPVSVTSIKDNEYNSMCPSSNAEYFGEYYGNSPLAPINMLGVTVPMTAESSVIPGNPYHIKLVIADYNDTAFDSAVFIDAGSFNIGSPESAELSITGGNILCDGESATININLDNSFTFAWSLNGVILPDETGNYLTVFQEGVYTVSVTLPSGCVLEFSTTIQAASSGTGTIAELQNYVVFEANTDGISNFDLNTRTTILLDGLNTEDFVVTYHLNLADAQSGMNALPVLYTNTNNPQTIYVRIANAQSDCFTVKTLKLIVVDQNFVAPAPTGAADQNFAPGATLADIVVEGQNIQWYDNPGSAAGRSGNTTNDNGDTPLPLSTLLVDNTTYYASQTIYGIESLQRLAVTVHLTMGVENPAFAEFRYQPNPVKDVLMLNNSEPLEDIVIYNLLGQAVYNKSHNSNLVEINLSALTNGIYMVKATSAGQEKIFKIIKE